MSFFLKNTFESTVARNIKSSRDEEVNAVNNLMACCKLVTHNMSNQYSAPELMKESFVAVFLTRCLQAKGYFDEMTSKNKNITFTENQMKVAIWIHHLMRVAKFNSHEVTEYNISENVTCEHGDQDCCRYLFYGIILSFLER